MATRAQPLSIESLLQKQREEKEAASKVCHLLPGVNPFLTRLLHTQPKFLSKEERAQLAIAKRTQEIREEREREATARRDREALEREAEEVRQKERNTRYGAGGRSERDRESRYSRRDGRDNRRGHPPRAGFQNVPTAPRADRSKTTTPAPAGSSIVPSSTSTPHSMPPPPMYTSTLPEPSVPYVPPMTEDEISAIRSRYLGVDKKKRKIRKMNDRKFVFDWDTQDDTLVDDSPIAAGNNRQGAQVMFGRGHLAGMDDGGGNAPRKKSSAADNFDMARLADPIERRKAVKAGVDERHWTDKPLSEMKDRDWRIFREDFSISARGVSLWLYEAISFLTNVFRIQAVKYPIPFVPGPSLISHRPFSKSLTASGTKNHLQSNAKPFQLVCKIGILSASLKLARLASPSSLSEFLTFLRCRFGENSCFRHSHVDLYLEHAAIYGQQQAPGTVRLDIGTDARIGTTN
jgi:ATP-dependent RNA helicase DDX23/PRP28